MEARKLSRSWVLLVVVIAAASLGMAGCRITQTETVSSSPSPYLVRPTAQPLSTSTPAPTPTIEPTKKVIKPSQVSAYTPTKELSRDSIPADLDKVLSAGGDWRAVVRGPAGELIYARYPSSEMHPASTIKVAIAMLVLDWMTRQPEGMDQLLVTGPATAGRSYEQLLRALLVNSEEEAAQKLQDDLVLNVGWNIMAQRLESWGAAHTSLSPRRSTAEDMANLIDTIYRKRLPTPATSQIILDLLAVQTAGDNVRIWKMKDLLPVGAVIYNKRGSLTDPLIVADIGIIELPDKRAYTVCLFGYSTGQPTFDQLDAMLGEFAVTWWRLQSQR